MSKLSTINVPAEVLQEFKQAVFAKHGRLYGALMLEATQAIRAQAERIRQEARQ